jgi:hypothetical protein
MSLKFTTNFAKENTIHSIKLYSKLNNFWALMSGLSENNFKALKKNFHNFMQFWIITL